MTRPRVHVTGPLMAEIDEALAHDFELVDTVEGADGVLAVLGCQVDDAFLERGAPTLRIIANFGVGVNNVDLEAARNRGIVVTNTPDVLTRTTAELAVGLMLALLRRIAEGDRFVRAKRDWEFSVEFMLGQGLDSKNVLVVGPGRIGRETARLVEAFGAVPSVAGRGDDLMARVADADVVTLHCPLTPDTTHLVDERVLHSMRPTAILVNTSRGPVVDERALVRALAERRLAGAALDVFEREPSVEEELLAMENVVLTPHIGSATRSTRVAMGMLCVDALRAVLLESRIPANAVVP